MMIIRKPQVRWVGRTFPGLGARGAERAHNRSSASNLFTPDNQTLLVINTVDS